MWSGELRIELSFVCAHCSDDNTLGVSTVTVLQVQYNPFGTLETFEIDDPRRHDNNSNGGLIAVSYEARAAGVKRGMRGDEARKICPELQLVTVPTAHGKADLTLYREQGAKVVDILCSGGPVERASVDEAYVDVTAQAQRLLSTAANGGDPWRDVLADARESKVNELHSRIRSCSVMR